MEYFKEVIVQERVAEFFARSLHAGRLAHAYLFYGPEGRGKEAFALFLAQALNCLSDSSRPCMKCSNCQRIAHFNHPDIRFIFPGVGQISGDKLKSIIQNKSKNPYVPIPLPGKRNISIEHIRELKEEAKYGAFEQGYRVMIISGAEYLSREAANSFLKLLEEPPQQFLLILISENRHVLLDTIRSRCQPVYFPEFSEAQIQAIMNRYGNDVGDLSTLIKLSRYNVKKLFGMLHQDYSPLKEWAYQFMRSVAAGHYQQVNELIEEARRKNDTSHYLELLDLLSGWCQDSFYLSAGEENLVHPDYATAIRNFTLSFPSADRESMIESIEKAKWAIENNAHPQLTLFNLAVELQELMGEMKALKEAT